MLVSAILDNNIHSYRNAIPSQVFSIVGRARTVTQVRSADLTPEACVSSPAHRAVILLVRSRPNPLGTVHIIATPASPYPFCPSFSSAAPIPIETRNQSFT
jgi:hypothetical protein